MFFNIQNYLLSVVDNLLACTDLFSFTAPFPAIISRTQKSKDRRLKRLFWFFITGLNKPIATSTMINSGEPELRLLFNISSLFLMILTSGVFPLVFGKDTSKSIWMT